MDLQRSSLEDGRPTPRRYAAAASGTCTAGSAVETCTRLGQTNPNGRLSSLVTSDERATENQSALSRRSRAGSAAAVRSLVSHEKGSAVRLLVGYHRRKNIQMARSPVGQIGAKKVQHAPPWERSAQRRYRRTRVVSVGREAKTKIQIEQGSPLEQSRCKKRE